MLLPSSAHAIVYHVGHVTPSFISSAGGCVASFASSGEYPSEMPAPAMILAAASNGSFLEKMSGRMKVPLKHFYFDEDHYVCVSDIWTDSDKESRNVHKYAEGFSSDDCSRDIRGNPLGRRETYTVLRDSYTTSYFGGCRGSLLDITHEVDHDSAMSLRYSNAPIGVRGGIGLECISPHTYSTAGASPSSGCSKVYLGNEVYIVNTSCSDILKAAAIHAAVEVGSCVKNPKANDTLCGIALGGSSSPEDEYVPDTEQNPFLQECYRVVEEVSDKIENSAPEIFNISSLLGWASAGCYSVTSASFYWGITASVSSFAGLCAGSIYGYFRNPCGAIKKPR